LFDNVRKHFRGSMRNDLRNDLLNDLIRAFTADMNQMRDDVVKAIRRDLGIADGSIVDLPNPLKRKA